MEQAGTVLVQTNIWAIGSFVFYLAIIIGIGIFTAKFSSSGIGEYFLHFGIGNVNRNPFTADSHYHGTFSGDGKGIGHHARKGVHGP